MGARLDKVEWCMLAPRDAVTQRSNLQSKPLTKHRFFGVRCSLATTTASAPSCLQTCVSHLLPDSGI